MALVYELDLDILKTYLLSKMEKFPTVRAQTQQADKHLYRDRKTDTHREMQPKTLLCFICS